MKLPDRNKVFDTAYKTADKLAKQVEDQLETPITNTITYNSKRGYMSASIDLDSDEYGNMVINQNYLEKLRQPMVFQIVKTDFGDQGYELDFHETHQSDLLVVSWKHKLD